MLTPNRRLKSIQEWSGFMKTSRTWNFRSIVGKIMMGLVLAVVIGSIGIAPAFGKNDKKMGKHHKGHYEYGARGYDHDRRHHGHDGYRERVYYAPPPVVYAPLPPPGISIFIPPIIIPIH
jgi:hypothetical protein